MLFLESLIMQTKRNDLHFRPPKDMDGLYKIDALSRILGENSHKTIAFGTQLSLANIEENFSEEIFGKKHKKMDEKNPKTYDSKYQKKFNEIKEIAQIMEKPNARESTEQFFGRISTPDIFCYTAINGIVKKKFAKEVRCLKKYFETWKEENFEKNGLLEYCHPDLQAVIGVVARHHLETQKYLISENFLEHCENNTEIITPQGEIILKNGEKIFFLKKDIWNAKTQEFTSELYSFSHREGVENSTLCAKSVYFLSENILAKMRKNIKK